MALTNSLDAELESLRNEFRSILRGGSTSQPGQPDFPGITAPGGQQQQEPDRALNFEQATELTRKLGIKTAEGKKVILENIQDAKLRRIVNDAVVAEQAVQDKDRGVAAFENKNGVLGTQGNNNITSDANKKLEIEKLNKQLALQEQQLSSARIETDRRRAIQTQDQQNLQAFGRPAEPAQSDIIQTSPGVFTNAPGAQGEVAVRGSAAQPAILSLAEKKLALAKEKIITESLTKRLVSRAKAQKGSSGKERKATAAQITATKEKNKFDALRADEANADKTDQQLREQATKFVKINSNQRIITQNTRDTSALLKNIQEENISIQNQKVSLDLQASILRNKDFTTSVIGGIKNEVGKYLSAFGFNPKDFGLNDPTQNAIFTQTTFESLMEKLRLQKGVQTEGDAQRALETFATLNTGTKESAMFIVDYMRSISERAEMRNNFFTSEIAKSDGALGPNERAQTQLAFNRILEDTPVFVTLEKSDGSSTPFTFSTYKDKIIQQARDNKVKVDNALIIQGWRKFAAKHPS